MALRSHWGDIEMLGIRPTNTIIGNLLLLITSIQIIVLKCLEYFPVNQTVECPYLSWKKMEELKAAGSDKEWITDYDIYYGD